MPKDRPLIHDRFCEIELFYCEELDTYFIAPPGCSELFLEQIPKFSCFNCTHSCNLEKENKYSLFKLASRILKSRNSYKPSFLISLKQYQDGLRKILNIKNQN